MLKNSPFKKIKKSIKIIDNINFEEKGKAEHDKINSIGYGRNPFRRQ